LDILLRSSLRSLAEKRACRRFAQPSGETLLPGRSGNFQVFDALGSLAALNPPNPQPHKRVVRYFRFYANRTPRGIN
jgi:hypothetical protein